jgi:hypothetical protein
MKVQPNPVGAELRTCNGFIDTRQAADLYADHVRENSPGLKACTKRK